MAFLLKVLVLIVGVGAAAKFGLLDRIGTMGRDAALRNGVSEDQMQVMGDQAQSLLSLDGILGAIAALPAPFDAIGRVAFIAVLVGLALSLLLAGVMAVVRTLRWVRDIVV